MRAEVGKFAGLPTVEDIRKKNDRMKAIDLLDEGLLIQSDIQRKSARLDEIKDELLLLQEEYELPGVRNGTSCFSATFMPGRRSLSKELLVENGCDPAIIAQSFKEGEGYWKKELKKLDE